MPAVIPVHAAIRSDLKDSVKHALTLGKRLELMIAVRSRQPSGTFHGKVDFSQPPWNSQVAHAITDLHALSRKLEKDLRYELGLPARTRGGSGGNTGKALESVMRLCDGADDFSVRTCIRELEKWGRRASIALNETEIPKRLPREPGEAEHPCPWCGNLTLRMYPFNQDGRGEVRCINPECRDEEKRRPAANLEYFRGELVLRWHDGVIGTP